MKYVAHAGIEVDNRITSIEEGKWYYIKKRGDIEYRWRFKDHICDAIAGPFENIEKALDCAKQMYVTLFYILESCQFFSISDAGCASYEKRFFDEDVDASEDEFLEKEHFFCFDVRYKSFDLGPGVYEVNADIAEVENNKHIGMSIELSYDKELDVTPIDTYLFSYCKDVQEYFDTIVLAEQMTSIGFKMTLYCGILESVSADEKKDKNTLKVIDELCGYVKESELDEQNKNSLLGFLNNGRYEGARKKCLNTCEKYAKEMYGGIKCESIVKNAYTVRSIYAHGKKKLNSYDGLEYMKFIVLDVLKEVFREREQLWKKNGLISNQD